MNTFLFSTGAWYSLNVVMVQNGLTQMKIFSPPLPAQAKTQKVPHPIDLLLPGS